MKKTLKKIAAVAMAFTLLGTGTTVTKTIAPQFDTSITAHAASCNNCHGGNYYMKTEYTDWKYVDDVLSWYYNPLTGRLLPRTYKKYKRTVKIYCTNCNKVYSESTEECLGF
ncbi:hypothetical protein [Ruminococcus flavefaciens]|uniref:hypothetical protein n=1 Tax=Ruminococcus flavefaciens TaxID=1265 RepID=UPI0026EA41CF|nr:hypothetical protein [Ruminococcus flavefaciens]